MPDQDGQPQPPHSELASFGEELRREREIRGISLKEIADATKISKRFLEAIERNDHRTLPAPVFTRGFVREYAKYLGLEKGVCWRTARWASGANGCPSSIEAVVAVTCRSRDGRPTQPR